MSGAGEQFRARRRELRLTRAAVAERAGYAVTTVVRLETDSEHTLTSTLDVLWRTLELFDAYDLPARMRAWRKRHGCSIVAAAEFAGIGETTWGETERDKRSFRPRAEVAARIEALLAGGGD